MKYIASCSFGKDSLAMLLRLIEENKPLDEVIFYDTGLEFQAIYNNRDKILPILKEHGIKYVELTPKDNFLYKMFEKPVKKHNGTIQNGYSWCGGRCRWGTTEKLKLLEKYADGCHEYVGIAYDEVKRLEKERKGSKSFPLAEWEMTEADCLQYCYDKGFDWLEDGVELYSILSRVSCWCCANKNLKELKNYYKYLPKYWNKLKEMQAKTDRPFYNNRLTIFELEEKFEKEIDKIA